MASNFAAGSDENIMNRPSYRTFTETASGDSDGDGDYRTPSTDVFNHLSDLIGPGPEEAIKLETIKTSISALRPYLQKQNQEKHISVDVLEILPSGESGYRSTKTLHQLLASVHEIVMEVDAKAAESEEAQSGKRSDDGSISSGKRSEEGGTGSGPGSRRRKQSEADITPRLIRSKPSSGRLSTDSITDSSTQKSIREIQYHDLRYLRYQLCNPYEEPSVLVRRHAVLLSLNPLRAIITADKMLLIVPHGADSLLYLLHEHMHGMVEDDDILDTGSVSSSEIRAYKAMFSTIMSLHTREYVDIQSKVEYVLTKLRKMKTIPAELQEYIRVLKNAVSSQTVKTKAYRRLLEELLTNEEDLALMNLSLLKKKPSLYSKPLADEILNTNEEVEVMIESYLMDYNTLSTKLEYLRAQIQNAEDLLLFRLDTARNELLIVDITLATVSLVVAIATFPAGVAGMNMASGIDDLSIWYFWGFFILAIMFMFACSYYLFSYYKITGTIPSTAERREASII